MFFRLTALLAAAALFGFGYANETVAQCATLDDTANETCTSVTFLDDWHGYEVIMPARGTRHEQGHMLDGWIINVGKQIGDASSNYLYILVHESDPRFDHDRGAELWGGWQVFKLVDNTQ